jgi:hypothetical protein
MRLKLVLRLNFASRGGELKGTKISSSSFLINDHMHADNSSKPCPPWERREERGERERREREREIGTLMLF